MIFNPTYNYQFMSRLTINDKIIEVIGETDLLGVKISSDLSWKQNTKSLVTRAYTRLILLQKLFEFQVPQSDLVTVYKLFIRSILEQSCVVWHSSITKEEEADIERVQKVCLKVILKGNYVSYEQSLQSTNLITLVERRENLCLNFAKKCLDNEKTKHMFPLNSSTYSMPKRNEKYQKFQKEKYHVQHAKTERLAKSAIPYLQRLLNKSS